MRIIVFFIIFAFNLIVINCFSTEGTNMEIDKKLPVDGQVFIIEDHVAFLILPKDRIQNKEIPWVWYAPTLPGLPGVEEKWMFERFLENGIAISGVDVGESFGNLEGRELFTNFYRELTQKYQLSKKACLLARSRGGLMLYNWAAEHPESVACITGIYPVCNLESYPGIEKASIAYNMTQDQLKKNLAYHNPVERLHGLAKEGVPILFIHGDSDEVVPLEMNSGKMAERYSKLGDEVILIVPKGQGHNMWQGFFQCQELVNFIIANANCKAISEKDMPIVLHNSIAMQWGGHTFSYLLTGQDNIFWSATDYNPNDKTPTALIGQRPKPGVLSPNFISKISFTGNNVMGNNQPQMIRSKDGYIHAFIGVTYTTDNPNYNIGRIHYYRSHKPEDISKLEDRTELIPKQPFYDFHLRMNVGISQNGERIALVILAISEDGSVPFNTPVIFIGEKHGADFVFKKPFKYAEPMGFFYPQIAVTDDGIIVVGEMWDKEKLHYTRLIHLDWDGHVVHREDFPTGNEGNYFSYDMRPERDEDWSKLIIYYNKQPTDHNNCRHEFWRYDTKARKLVLLRSLDTEYSESNPGKWLSVSKTHSIFVNNPSLGQLIAWEGDILGGGEVLKRPIPNANPSNMNYQFSAYVFAPNVLQGAILSQDEIYLASDFVNMERERDKSGPCSFMLWRIKK